MYLFKEKDEVEIPYTCKLCLTELKFKITADEYKKVSKFPIKKEIEHGDPNHILVAYFNQYLEVENFKIKELTKERDVKFSEELTKQVLSELDLSSDEVELYFRTTGREAVSIGEMAILINRSKEDCQKIAKKFVEKGLFKEIVGAKPHYAALPPYAALVAQLQNFHQYISDIKSDIPKQLDQSFKKLETTTGKIEKSSQPVTPTVPNELMKELKDNMLSQIKSQKEEFNETMAVMEQIRGITDDISLLESSSGEAIEPHSSDLTTQFQKINENTNQIIKGQLKELKDEFGTIKTTISQNLQKLRLGVIQSTVDQVIEKIVDSRLQDIIDNINVQLSVNQMTFSDELKKTTVAAGGINTEILDKIKDTIQKTVKNLDGITAKSEEDKEKIFESITENFNKAVLTAESKIDGISGGVFESFGDLKDMFSNQIVSTLDNTLSDILKKLERSEKVTKEFWDQAKFGEGLTMKDIWFIRSPESAKAHINDEISKAKMRVLIVAPQITDVDINAIKERPTRINFRIASSIDLSNQDHLSIINQLDQMDNVDYRHRGLQNLWGINRDYEEVIVCVLSKTEIRGDSVTEIAGLGSIIEEHIKIFVPILEEAWMSARKEVVHSIKANLTQEPLKEKIAEQPMMETAPKEELPPHEHKTDKTGILGKQFDLIFENIDSLTGIEIAAALEKFQSEYIKLEGYNSVLKNVNAMTSTLKSKSFVLSQSERDDLRVKMKFWHQKFQL
ncbi:MAG: hypothetical protein KGD73_11945 [Candidatus Lokiarchaeota archaeon]|nr:hypothetical protein [Candidatus Lokiarchaeota archaeon]